MMTRIAVVTGTRAEYGILNPVLKAIHSHPKLTLSLWVTGTHLLKAHGYTVENIISDGWKIDHIIPMYRENDMSYTSALAEGISNFARAMSEDRPDWILVLGDRLEPFAAVQSACLLGVPIAHIHGGDKTSGTNIDEPIRHSITRFAQVHFPASEASRKRLIAMGEEPSRIYMAGAPALDTILAAEYDSPQELQSVLKFDQTQPFVLCIQHSVTSQHSNAYAQMTETLAALERLDLPCVIIYPNNDAGHDGIITAIEEHRHNPKFLIYKSLPQSQYLGLLHTASVIVGNTSSGLIEAPSFGLPMVHVGDRNRGREHGGNVLFVGHNRVEIFNALNFAINDSAFRCDVKYGKSPFGDGNAGKRIAETLANLTVTPELMTKKITY